MADDLPPEIQALIGGQPEKKKGSSLIGTILAILVLTIAGAGAGGFLGLQVLAVAETAAKKKAEVEAEKPQPEYAEPLTIKTVPPIIANLANPSTAWLRMEASVVFDGEAPEDADALVAQIGADALAFVKTVSLRQIEGASGLLHLREDLTERAKIRSEGRVREFIIQALAVE